jgi:hypothetical protein
LAIVEVTDDHALHFCKGKTLWNYEEARLANLRWWE